MRDLNATCLWLASMHVIKDLDAWIHLFLKLEVYRERTGYVIRA